MTFSLKASSGVILGLVLLILPLQTHATTLFHMNSGTTIQKVGFPNPETPAGATSTALFNASAGSTLYIAYCLNLTNQTASALVNQQGMATSTYLAPVLWSEAAYAIPGNGGTQEICHTSTTTLYVDVNAGQDYFMAWSINGVHLGATWDMDSPGDYLYVANSPIVPPDNTTHIIAAIPDNGETVASSTSGIIGALINVNTDQWTQALAQNAGNWFVRLTLTPPIKPNVLGGAFASGQSISFTFPITDSGISTLATTTDLSTFGNYTESIQIVQPSWASTYLSWFGFSGTVLDSTTTRFTVGIPTGFDKLNASSTSIIDQFLASTSPQLIASCASFTSFDLADCLNLLFIPQPSTFSYVLADVQGILQFAPWGYATRAITILSGSATSSLPLIAAGIPDPSDPHHYMMFHFDPNEMIAGAATLNDNIVDPVSGDPVMPGIRQIVDTIIALSTITYIFYDLISGRKSSVRHKTKLS